MYEYCTPVEGTHKPHPRRKQASIVVLKHTGVALLLRPGDTSQFFPVNRVFITLFKQKEAFVEWFKSAF